MKFWVDRIRPAGRVLTGKGAVFATLALAAVAIVASLALLKPFAWAQTWPAYYNSAQTPSDLPGMRLSLQYNLVSPTSSDLVTVYGTPASPAAPAPSARIVALARSLENDPDRIYQFVHNSILFEPQFGLHKGADGVLLDGSGGSFDQAQLMVELLRTSNIQARYVFGTVNLTGADAKSILRVDTGRQACILLATAGTPATINNGTTSCANLGATLSDVQMLHVWVEAFIDDQWYAFDPSLKTTTKITGVDLWAAADTSASAAWSNVSSGVSVSGGDLNGVNATHIENDMVAYAMALQTNLINNHTEKSLKQLTGGWEIVRTEAAPRNITLPRQASVSTRWTGDVPTPYRATLRLQAAGFDHVFDLPSIYGWRTQAQFRDGVLRVAVRKKEHLDADAAAYFADELDGGLSINPCDGVHVFCANVPGQHPPDGRRLTMTIDHPYAARKTGAPTANLGTFGDETVVKQLQAGKRADILLRTAGGNGGRKAAWAAAYDPIQQHRIVPAGRDFDQCYLKPPVWNPDLERWEWHVDSPSDCDEATGVDWRYWVPDSAYGNGPFATGEVAVAEMGTRKDSLLNGWTDLFDGTVAILEPLSGARIFHQHSIGVALTTGDNVLDIETSVGIAANGADQPHHILSALAALAVTEEALALSQSGMERPSFKGSPFQVITAPRRLATGTGLKVLTAPGSTTSLPADVNADTKDRIEAYLTKGYSVVATTTGGVNAFLARRNDGSEQAWIIRSSAEETGHANPLIAFRKGAEQETPNPVDYLGKAESRRIAANVAGSLLGAVDLRTGTLSFSEGAELSIGQGDFPYSLSFSRSYVSTGPMEGTSGLGMGWTHNWESSVSHAMDVGTLLPQAGTETAAPMLMAAMIALEAGRADTLQAAVVSGIALDFLQEQVATNIVTVSGGGQSSRFVRMVDGSWRNPASPTESIAPASAPFIGADTREINWTLADGSVMAFRDVENPSTLSTSTNLHGVATSWTFPTGVVITLTYGGGTDTNTPALESVSNNLGATLTFTHTQTPTQAMIEHCPTMGDPQACHEALSGGGRLTKVQAGPDEINFEHLTYCPQFVNFCAFQLYSAQRPGLRKRIYTYGFPTGGLATAVFPMDYQQVLTQVSDEGVTTPRARFDWRAVGGQVAPYVAEAFDAQNRKTVYYPSTFTYSAAKDATDAVIRQTYDDDGRLVTAADAMGRTSRARYDGAGRSSWMQTPWGDTTEFTYDRLGNLRERKQSPLANCATGLTVQQQAWWCQEIVVKAEYANTTWPTRPTKIVLPATEADPQVREWEMEYNSQGLVTLIRGPRVENGLNNNVLEHPTWATGYDNRGRPVWTQDPTGIRSTMAYGESTMPAFCLTSTTMSAQPAGVAGMITRMECDVVGNVTKVTDARNNVTTSTYDNLRRKRTEDGPASTAIKTIWSYNIDGDLDLVRQWDSTGNTWRDTITAYSATHKPLTVTDPDGDLTRTCYDAVDRPVTVIDGERRATHTVYNAAGQPTEIHRFQRAAAGSCGFSTELPQDAGFTETRWRRFQYNAGGLQSAEIDARGNVTQQQYDGVGRPIRTIYPNTLQAWTAMDERGQVVVRKTRANHWASVFYDGMGRDFHVREYANSETAYKYRGRNSRANYDLAGRPVWRAVSNQTTQTNTYDEALNRDVRTYSYDQAGRLTSEQWRPEGVAGISFTTGYGYDTVSNRTSITWPGAWTAAYAYDAANRVKSVNFPGPAGAPQVVALDHDSLSRLTRMDRPGAAADTTYTYDADSDLAVLSHGFVAGTGPGAVSFSYGHDAAGKITSIGIDQPAFEWMPTLTYARSYGAANVMNQVASETDSVTSRALSFDGNGNLSQEVRTPVVGGTPVTWTYHWTYGNRLGVVTNNAAVSPLTASYHYDSDDRRTKKVVNGVTRRMMWSGMDELAEYDVNGDLLRRFIPDGTGAMDARLATVTPTGDVYWHHTDHQGSVIATSNSAGETVGVASYSPYGEFGGDATTTPQHSPFGYAGRQYDEETGLYQYRARYYSPRLGQFLSSDPIGTKDDPNLYLYVANDPVNLTDPTGMECKNNTEAGTTNCVTKDYNVTFKTTDSFPGTDASRSDFHYYDETAQSHLGVDATRNWVQQNPTPGDPSPATPGGTRNDATPVIGGLPGDISPVSSITTTNTVSGNPVVVNVTLPGHPLFPGIVVREVVPNADGTSTIHNRGEGNGDLQRPGAPFAGAINGVWRGQRPPPPTRPSGPTCSYTLMGCR